jgi:hypothetical protein
MSNTSDGLVPSADIIAMQKEMNIQVQEDYEASKLRNITPETVLKDMADAIQGIFDDIMGTEALGFWAIISKDNRLRGLGMIFILVSASILFIKAVTAR